ncbi:T9SS type A sorting domain-containing protein [Aurantibacillus circumpalustris]|uniref:T9SS type A sorting domain-containing protein n=1 Tax=Aurantibacillus circumpalustris TaxID=3036359 RepID=UPI00295A8C46|nr:T9SS type A sorting domain-containing protein [Aurantibacillus circumpalustris]
MKKFYSLIFIALFLFCGKAFAQCITPTNTPYYEDFSSITANTQLPPCWAISNPSTCLTFTSPGSPGNGAVFYHTPGGTSYFYSKAIQLSAGVTYSSSVWYKVNPNLSGTWTNLSLSVGTSQNNTGLLPIASTTGNILNSSYSALSNTFTVPSSGVYYLVVSATSNGSGTDYLMWDDLSVIIPCTPTLNTPTVNITTSSTVLCSGNGFTATASGASTYTWSNGTTGSSITGTPSAGPNLFIVLCGDNLTGCTATASVQILVNPSPVVLAVTSKTSVCLGSSAILSALGASTYTWSNNQTGSTLIVTPTVTTTYSVTYSVIGTGTNGCTAANSVSIGVEPLPSISYTSSASTSTVCKGDLVTYNAYFIPGFWYIWNANPIGGMSGNSTRSFSISPIATTTISLGGSDEGGCMNFVSIILYVDECTGLPKTNALSTIKIYPNPGKGVYVLEAINSETKNIVVTDVVGKIIYSEKITSEISRIDISNFANGVYHVLISSESGKEHLKIIKQ